MRAKPDLLIREKYRDALASLGLRSFTDFMEFGGGELVRDKGEKTITRISAAGGAVLYLKRHFRCTLREVFKSLLALRRPLSPAAAEWRSIGKLRAAGLETMEPVAYGERRRFPSLGPSFIVTAAVEGRCLEEHARFLRGKSGEKRSIISALADCARMMHGAGLNHRDFYLSHIFIRNGSGCAVVLIDLQRVQERARGRNRWVVKDLAALSYSSPAPVVSRTDRVRFLHRYLGVRSLNAAGKRFAKRIERKTERIRAHDAKRPGGERARGRG